MLNWVSIPYTLKQKLEKHSSKNKKISQYTISVGAVNAQQLFIKAQAAAQLAVLPTFSNVFKDDNLTPTQWLQKVIDHKTGAAWTDEQTITHVMHSVSLGE